MRIGILTAGGDAPGLNGILESSGRVLLANGVDLLGIHDGFEGVFHGQYTQIDSKYLVGLHALAGTKLGTCNKSLLEGRREEFQTAYKKLGIDGMIVAGGDGTFAALAELAPGLPIVAVPKTIDNDLHGTELTFGFDTACSVVADAVDALRATAEAHSRVMLVEVMGRTAGWIALGGGLASYADAILVPERPFSKEIFKKYLLEQKALGRRGLVVVVSESATPEGEKPDVAFVVEGAPEKLRYGGIAERLSRWITDEAHWEARSVVLGHLQRSHAPTTTDRFLTAAMGVEAARAALAGDWKKAIVYREGRVLRVPLGEIKLGARVIPQDHRWIALAKSLGIFL